MRERLILWKDFFNKKRIKLLVLNKIDYCEIWVNFYRVEYVRLIVLYNKIVCNSWYRFFCCFRGEVVKVRVEVYDVMYSFVDFGIFFRRYVRN